MQIGSILKPRSQTINSSNCSSVPLLRRATTALLLAGVFSQTAHTQEPAAVPAGAGVKLPAVALPDEKEAMCPLPLLKVPPQKMQGSEVRVQPRHNPQIDECAQRMEADDYRIRDKAQEDLTTVIRNMQKGTWEAQLQQIILAGDAEVRLRCKKVRVDVMAEELWEGAKVTIERGEMKTSAIVEQIEKQTGNLLLQGDQYGNLNDKVVYWPGGEMEYWQALDLLCMLSENKLRPHYDPRVPATVLSKGKPGQYPVAYAGAFRLQATSSRRAFSEEIDFEEPRSDISHTFQMNLQLQWEQGCKMVAYRQQPEVVRAITPQGENIRSTQQHSGSWNLAGGGSRQLNATLRLHPPKVAAKEFKELVLKWGFIVVGDMQTIEIDNPKAGIVKYQDDVECTVVKVEEQPGKRVEVTIRVLRDLLIEDPQEAFFVESELELIDDAGVPYRKHGQTNSFDDNGATMRVMFVADSPDSKPATSQVKFTYPRVRSLKEVEIPFQGAVPLPAKNLD